MKLASQIFDHLGGQLKDARNLTAYVEGLLAFEERSGCSSMLSELQLE